MCVTCIFDTFYIDKSDLETSFKGKSTGIFHIRSLFAFLFLSQIWYMVNMVKRMYSLFGFLFFLCGVPPKIHTRPLLRIRETPCCLSFFFCGPTHLTEPSECYTDSTAFAIFPCSDSRPVVLLQTSCTACLYSSLSIYRMLCIF